MERIISSRGLGKTTSLVYAANYYANENPDIEVIFVCSSPSTIRDRFRDQQLHENLHFASYNEFLHPTYLRGRRYMAFIDEIDVFLNHFNVNGYSMTIDDKLGGY